MPCWPETTQLLCLKEGQFQKADDRGDEIRQNLLLSLVNAQILQVVDAVDLLSRDYRKVLQLWQHHLREEKENGRLSFMGMVSSFGKRPPP